MSLDKRIGKTEGAPSIDAVQQTEEALIAAYRMLIACQSDKKRQLPDLLVDLVPTREWVVSVAKSQAARDAFLEAAARFCTERIKAIASANAAHSAPMAHESI